MEKIKVFILLNLKLKILNSRQAMLKNFITIISNYIII